MREKGLRIQRRRTAVLWSVALSILLWFAHTTAADALQQPPREPAQQDEFVPIDTLPPDEQLPAAPLLISAYAAAWLVVLIYLWSIWQRLRRVEREIADVSRRVGQGRIGARSSELEGLAAPKPRSGGGG